MSEECVPCDALVTCPGCILTAARLLLAATRLVEVVLSYLQSVVWISNSVSCRSEQLCLLSASLKSDKRSTDVPCFSYTFQD